MYKGVALVRDKDGNPKIDGDPNALHPSVQQMLTVQEREVRGMWTGALAKDAQGIKKLTKVGDKVFRAEEALVAVSEIFDGDNYYRLAQRIDVPVGSTFGSP